MKLYNVHPPRMNCDELKNIIHFHQTCPCVSSLIARACDGPILWVFAGDSETYNLQNSPTNMSLAPNRSNIRQDFLLLLKFDQ